MNDKEKAELLKDLEALEANNEAISIQTGIVPVSGGYNAIIILETGESFQFTEPVFRRKQKAILHARKKAGDLIAFIAKNVEELGYETIVDSPTINTERKQ